MKEQLERYLRKGLPAGATFSVEEAVLFSGTTIYGKVSGGGQEWEKKAQEWLSLDLSEWAKDNLPTSTPATVSGPSNPTPDFEEMDRWIATTGQVVPTVLGLNTAVLADAFCEVEKHDLQVTTVYARADTYSDLRRLSVTVRNTDRSDLHRGFMASLWGAEVIVSRNVPENTVYCCSYWGRDPHLNPKGFSKLVVTP